MRKARALQMPSGILSSICKFQEKYALPSLTAASILSLLALLVLIPLVLWTYGQDPGGIVSFCLHAGGTVRSVAVFKQ